jgi:hypothetical protein
VTATLRQLERDGLVTWAFFGMIGLTVVFYAGKTFQTWDTLDYGLRSTFIFSRGVAMFVASFLVKKRGKDYYTSAEKEQAEKDSEQSSTFAGGSERPYTALSPEALQRVAAHLREEALTGNLRPRRRPDPAEENPDR